MARLAPTIPDPAPLPGVERLDLAVLSLRRYRRFGPDLPAVAPLPADLPVGAAARAEDLLLAAPAPGEWLLLGPHSTVAALAAQQPADQFLATEVGEAHAIFRLAPQLAAEALAAYAPIDPAALSPGTATRAQVAGMTALLIPEPDGSLLLLVDAADADHLIALLALLTTDP
jgi:sarcosine oxidase gamma subunit